ncbi:MAG: hypothetical protein JJT77_05840 [Crocinitomicaceae bacterium]|nr:hypothetical protein [Crocinitomicaceae bacterium]
MRIFVLSTGRSGSTTFARACQHIKNYSSGHEINAGIIGEDRYSYPDNHIESDNRLCWHLGQLHELYKDEDTVYIYIRREKNKIASSFMKRYFKPASIIDAFCEGIQQMPPEKLTKAERLEACHDYIDTLEANVRFFMSHKPNTFFMQLENIQEEFERFWEFIGAEGSLEAALEEFNKQHNASQKRKLHFLYRYKLLAKREIKHWRTTIEEQIKA